MKDVELASELLYHIGIAPEVSECMSHSNENVMAMAEEAGKLIMEHDLKEGTGKIADMIKRHRFEAHNREYLAMLDASYDGDMLDKRYVRNDVILFIAFSSFSSTHFSIYF